VTATAVASTTVAMILAGRMATSPSTTRSPGSRDISLAWAGHALTTAKHHGQRETASTRSRSRLETSAPERPRGSPTRWYASTVVSRGRVWSRGHRVRWLEERRKPRAAMQDSGDWANLPATTRPPQRVRPEATQTRITDDQRPIREPATTSVGWTGRWVQWPAEFLSTCHPDGDRIPGPDPVRSPLTTACWPVRHPRRLLPGLLTVRQSWLPERQAVPCRSIPPS
jgi:hypothetical protein